jgi:hypothetical protein
MKNFTHIYVFALLFLGLAVFAQEKDKSLPLANEEYADNKFVDAEAIIGFKFKIPNRTVASYNLGNAIYKQNQASEAKFAYAEAIKILNQDLKT